MNDLSPLSPSLKVLSQLDSYEDYLSFYVQLEEAHGMFAWLKADTLHQMQIKLGDNSPTQLAKDLKLPPSTVSNYIRAAKAFPSDKRDPLVSFSAHLEASFSDSYNDKTGIFDGINRFDWIEKAVAEQIPTRQLKREIALSKEDNPEKGHIVSMSQMIMHFIGALKDKAVKGDLEAKAKLENVYTFINESYIETNGRS